MISFFRRILSSWVTLIFLGIVGVAIVVTGVGTPSGIGGLGASSGTLITAGDQSVSEEDVRTALEQELNRQREERPGFDMAALVRAGAYESIINELENLTALRAFAEANGMQVSKKLADGEIVGIQAFQGTTGSFDETRFRAALAERRVTETQFRNDLMRAIYTRHLLVPVSASSGMPGTLTLPYASLMLEKRSGSVVAIPASIIGSTLPTEAEVSQFYSRNLARYTVPELRSVRYTSFDRSRFEGKVKPTEADVAAYYKANAARFASRELRGMTQIIVQDQAAATAIAAKVKAGTSMADAARGAGVEALTLKPMEKPAYAGQSSDAVANAVFALAAGRVTAPVKSGLGWHVVRVDSVSGVAGKSQDAARAEILPILEKSKVDDALAQFEAEVADAVDDGKTFDEVVKQFGLQVTSAPAVTGSGIDPANPDFSPSPELGAILKSAFQMEQGDDPEVAALGNGRFAFYTLDRITPSTPKPLAEIRPMVLRDATADKASKAAKRIAEAVALAANKGTALPAAVAASGAKLPPIQNISARRIDLSQTGREIPPPVALMFNMTPRKAKVMEMPGKQGWFVVWLASIEEGDARKVPELLVQTQREMANMVGQEYVQQFTNAAKADVGSKRKKDAIAAFKRSLITPAAR